MPPLVRRIAIVLLAMAVGAAAMVLLPSGSREIMEYEDLTGKTRHQLVATRYAAVAGTPWATRAATDVLADGGTACDAALAALLVLNVTHGEAASFPGVAPTMIYDAGRGEVRSYVGAGTAPVAATLERFRERGFETVPVHDLWAQLVPASPDVLISLLRDCGSRSFGEVAAPAIDIAGEGFPAHAILVRNFDLPFWKRLGLAYRMPYNTRVFLQGEWWRPMRLHERMRFPDLAGSLAAMARAESETLAAGGSREDGLRAARDYFYRGPLAAEIVDYHRRHGGLITDADLAGYQGGWEEPILGRYGPFELRTHRGWSQGIVTLLALQILDGVDLATLAHNSPAYVHTVAQALELAFADRDAYVGDEAFVDVPFDELLSPFYAAARRRVLGAEAFGSLPPPGRIAGHAAAPPAATGDDPPSMGGLVGQDTSQVVVVDAAGNAVVITPSDFPATPMIPGTGLTLGNRMTQFRLVPGDPTALAPGKRPRITPHAVVVTRDGRLDMAFSTPGGDMQPQALVQVFLNLHVFGMELQDAISAPRFYSISVPSSFAPHPASPGTLRLEAELHDAASEGLRDLGYILRKDPVWDKDFGAVGAIRARPGGGLIAGADPREETWADGR